MSAILNEDHPNQVSFNLVQWFQREDLNVKVYDICQGIVKSSHGLSKKRHTTLEI